MNASSDFFKTPWFWSAFGAWTLAQCIKMVVDLLRTRRLDLSYLVSTGGMPSAHSALVSAMAMSVAMTEGFASPVTLLAACFAGITMFDAAGVRNAAGHQARLLNKIVDELFYEHRFNEARLKELLGHTRLEVFVGMILGILTGMLVASRWILRGML